MTDQQVQTPNAVDESDEAAGSAGTGGSFDPERSSDFNDCHAWNAWAGRSTLAPHHGLPCHPNSARPRMRPDTLDNQYPPNGHLETRSKCDPERSSYLFAPRILKCLSLPLPADWASFELLWKRT